MSSVRLLSFLFAALFLGGSGQLWATHYLAGQITYKKTGPNRYLITLTTYADRSSQVFAGNCFVSLEMGDGTTISNIPRKNGQPGNCGPNAREGEPIIRNIQKSIYETEYTYSGPGIFQVRFFDDNRYAGIINMTNSVGTSFYVYSTIRNIPGLSSDCPELLNDPVDIACIGEIFTHSPGGYDPDGDSLSYTLIPSMQYRPNGTPTIPFPIPVTNYQFPDNVAGNTPGSFSQNPFTGMITWNTPLVAGYYNIAFRVVSYRRGVATDTVVRDMVIIVDPNCNNRPPIVRSIPDTCVRAGDTLRFAVTAWDPDPADSVYLYLNNSGTINNGPFAPTLPAPQATISFIPPSGIPVIVKSDTIRGIVEWIPNCAHVRRNPYQVDFFVHDNMVRPPNEKFLTAYYSLQIRVRPPGLGTLVATPQRKSIRLTWGKSPCSEVHSYRIYRKDSESPLNTDTVCCDNTPESLGFQLIGTSVINDPQNGVVAWTDTTFTDTTVEYGKTYCYVIVGNINENPISEGVLTCPTNQVCVYIANEAPLMTHVSIEETDATTGKVFVSWSQPIDVDSSGVIAPRPLNYSLFRAPGIGGTAFSPIASRIPYGDTTFFDSLLDTRTQGWTYRVELLEDDNGKISESVPASSLFLNIQPGEKQLSLDWSPALTPWSNDRYYIWKSDSTMTAFTLLDSTDGSTLNYLDTGLINYQKYCYYIESRGAYSSPRAIDSLFNKSQRVCEAPRDLTPPCLPDESSIQVQATCNELTVFFAWARPDSLCAPDLGYYLLSRGEKRGGPYTPFYQAKASDSSYTYRTTGSIAGCYVLQAGDTSNNLSPYSREFCVDNCPELNMGNVFTPNGDGYNDFFTPVGLRAVNIDYFSVYDRWGNLLYSQNSDPVKLWDGNTRNGPAREGVYFYVLKGVYIRLDQPEEIHITGTVTLLR